MLQSCGGNSEAINNFPINGLRADGECNLDGVQLVPRSMTGGKDGRCDNSTLDVRDNKLVGIKSNGVIACQADELIGAKFTVRSWVRKPDSDDRLTMTIAIDDVRPYHPSTTWKSWGDERTSYKMSFNGASLCTATAASAARQALGLTAITGLTDPVGADKDAETYVIPVVSELYSRSGIRVPVKGKWSSQSPEWLNLACVNDSLAKRSLYGLLNDNFAKSRAALNMLVARYCGQRHITKRGEEIAWEFADDSTATLAKSGLQLEAKWDENGAVCVSRPRILYDDGKTLPPSLPVAVTNTATESDPSTVCPTCQTPSEWMDKLRQCVYAFPTGKAPAQPLPTCEQCTTAACSAQTLRSYIIQQPARQP